MVATSQICSGLIAWPQKDTGGGGRNVADLFESCMDFAIRKTRGNVQTFFCLPDRQTFNLPVLCKGLQEFNCLHTSARQECPELSIAQKQPHRSHLHAITGRTRIQLLIYK